MSGQVPPASIGRYKPLDVLGAGAMGTVYRAHDPLIDRIVAIKVIRTDSVDPDMREEYIDRFRREVQAAGRCSHASIVGVFDFSGDADFPFIVMEFVEGRSLQQLMRDPASRADLQIIPVLMQVLDGLRYAHNLGITHRDIKPANILVTSRGDAKIADFGIARISGTSLTQAGSMLGTPSYMAPEQVSELDVDHRADLFAVGAILYEFLTGKPPFAGRNLSDTIMRLTGPSAVKIEPLEAIGAGEFGPLLLRALAKRREERFQTADAFKSALAPFANASHSIASPNVGATVVMSPPPRMSGTQVGSTQVGGWDPALLQRVEKALASYVGPMARVMVGQAARQAASADELYQTLARELESANDRTSFLRTLSERVEPSLSGQSRAGQTLFGQTVSGAPTVGGQSLTRGVPAGDATGNQSASGLTGGNRTLGGGTIGTGSGSPTLGLTNAGLPPGGISQQAMDAAQAALVVFVGPMARVLVRQASAQATSPKDFIERLCAHVSKPDDNTALRRRLRAEVEPKLR